MSEKRECFCRLFLRDGLHVHDCPDAPKPEPPKQPLNMAEPLRDVASELDKNRAFQINRTFYPITILDTTGAELMRFAGNRFDICDLWQVGVGAPDRKIEPDETVRVRPGVRFYTAPKYINQSSQPEPPPDVASGCEFHDTRDIGCAVCNAYAGQSPDVASEPDNGCGECQICIRCMIAQQKHFSALRAENAALKAQIEKWQNDEASVCPEDFGFVEYVMALKAKLKAADHLIVTLTDNSAGFEAERDEARAEAQRFESELKSIWKDEEEICPDGVGFVEFIRALQAEAQKLREERDATLKKLERAEAELKTWTWR